MVFRWCAFINAISIFYVNANLVTFLSYQGQKIIFFKFQIKIFHKQFFCSFYSSKSNFILECFKTIFSFFSFPTFFKLSFVHQLTYQNFASRMKSIEYIVIQPSPMFLWPLAVMLFKFFKPNQKSFFFFFANIFCTGSWRVLRRGSQSKLCIRNYEVFLFQIVFRSTKFVCSILDNFNFPNWSTNSFPQLHNDDWNSSNRRMIYINQHL